MATPEAGILFPELLNSRSWNLENDLLTLEETVSLNPKNKGLGPTLVGGFTTRTLRAESGAPNPSGAGGATRAPSMDTLNTKP